MSLGLYIHAVAYADMGKLVVEGKTNAAKTTTNEQNLIRCNLRLKTRQKSRAVSRKPRDAAVHKFRRSHKVSVTHYKRIGSSL